MLSEPEEYLAPGLQEGHDSEETPPVLYSGKVSTFLAIFVGIWIIAVAVYAFLLL